MNRVNKYTLLSLFFFTSLFETVLETHGQNQDFDGIKIQTTKLTDNLFMLTGSGGNLGVLVGADGVFLVDDQFAPLNEKIRTAINALNEKPVRFVLNTHWHFDHTGGNEKFGESGSVIVAHENVRKRMTKDQFMEDFDKSVPAAPIAALPIVTFTQDIKFHINGNDIEVVHFPHAHTDGDAIVYFHSSDVVHMGDIFFNGLYPFIDTSSGGSVDGVIQAGEEVLKRIGAKTKIIPGHGPLADKESLSIYLEMLKDVRDRIQILITEGKSLEAVKAENPTSLYDEKWGNGFLSPDKFVEILYNNMQ